MKVFHLNQSILDEKKMRNIFFGVLMVAVILGQKAFAQSLPMETSQSIGIIDFVIKKSKYEEVSCGAHSCQMKSVEGGGEFKTDPRYDATGSR